MGRKRKVIDQNQAIDLPFPLEGLDETRSYLRQRPGTTVSALNVRSFEPGTDRARGGQRPGLKAYMRDRVNGDTSVQMIEHITTAQAGVAGVARGYYTFARASGVDMGLADTTGTVVWSDAEDAYKFACSCWDEDENLYVAKVNTTTGVVSIKRYAAATGTVVWLKTISVTTAGLRNFCGMVVIGNHLYVARKLVSGTTTDSIMKMNRDTGAMIDALWRTNILSTAHLVFSTSAINCLGRCGDLLGVECRSTSNNQCFLIFDTNVSTKNVYKRVVYGGTGANNRSCVVSDGSAYFYSIASMTTTTVAKIGIGGTLEWTSSDAGTANGLCYDRSNGFLLAACTSTPSVRRLSLSGGATVSSGDPGTITAWSWIDTNGDGTYTLWRDAQATNDIMGMTSAYATQFGPITSPSANTTHSGSSSGKGLAPDQSQGSALVTRLLAVAGGVCVRFDADGITALSGGDSFSAGASTIYGAQNGSNMYFVDGASYRMYNAATDLIAAWTPTTGTIPRDTQNRPARLLETWRGRSVIAGFPDQPQIYAMSKQFDPLDWDTSPSIPTSTSAFAGTNDLAGYVGHMITGIIPYTDDTLLFLCDHAVYQLTGDPRDNGTVDMVSASIGGAWGRAWCMDPSGQIYFMGDDTSIYKLTPGSVPVRVSQQITARLHKINLKDYAVRLAWDLRRQGVGVWVTPRTKARNPTTSYRALGDPIYPNVPGSDNSFATTNYFWEERTNAWWPDVYVDSNHNPLAVHVFDGPDPDDRVILLGGRDGRIRYLTSDATDDDGVAIPSHVVIGPFKTPDLDEVMVNDVLAILSNTSGTVNYEVFVGGSPEEALGSDPVSSGSWVPDDPSSDDQARWGRQLVSYVRWAGHVVYVRLSALEPWAVEKLTARIRVFGKLRGRI